MSDNIEKYILKIPILRLLITIPQKIYLPRFKGLTLYDLIKTYFFGIIEGTFSSRAGSIAFSFFMALFPFILFLCFDRVLNVDYFNIAFKFKYSKAIFFDSMSASKELTQLEVAACCRLHAA